jgi:hypothetical protein
MNRFVREFGGQLVLDVVGPNPSFANADYWFDRENVVAELKCLSEDKSQDPRQRAAIQKLFDSFVDSGRIPDPGVGLFRVETKDCPAEFQRGVYKILARPMKRRLDKANRQIKVTRRKLGREDAYGLVLLANDGDYRLEPAQFRQAVEFALGTDFSAIEGLVLFTVNLLSTSPAIGPHMSHANVWMPCARPGHRVISQDFLSRLCDGWFKHVGHLIGEPIPVLHEVDPAQIESFVCDQRVSRARS